MCVCVWHGRVCVCKDTVGGCVRQVTMQVRRSCSKYIGVHAVNTSCLALSLYFFGPQFFSGCNISKV